MRSDDDLAEGMLFTDVGEGFGYLGKPDGAVDVDADVSGDAHFGQRLEVRRTLPDGQYSEPAAGDQPGGR